MHLFVTIDSFVNTFSRVSKAGVRVVELTMLFDGISDKTTSVVSNQDYHHSVTAGLRIIFFVSESCNAMFLISFQKT